MEWSHKGKINMKIDAEKLKKGLLECHEDVNSGSSIESGFTLGDVNGCRIHVTISEIEYAKDEGIADPMDMACITD